MALTVSADHWTIDLDYGVRMKMKTKMIRFTDSPEVRKAAWDTYNAWAKEHQKTVPRNGNRSIFYKTEAAAKAAFNKAKLDPKLFSITQGFFL